ncbi:MAG: hypothetical protein M3T96_08975 [Acidobacteriota bacterium]|nr:hypothetical protein [Acidobacteriota bacterium]
MTAIINKMTAVKNAQNSCAVRQPSAEAGMTLLAVMAFLTLLAIALLAVAPTIQQGVQREKELETIRRGEEVADAIRQYMVANGGKQPDSMDKLLEGIPFGTKKRQILRPSAAVDPLSEDGKWRLIEFNGKGFINFGRRVQNYNNGVLPANPEPRNLFDRYAFGLVNNIDTKNDDDLKEDSDEEYEVKTDKTPFIGVASQSRTASIITYYGIENHSKWIFTPMFRGAGAGAIGGNPNTSRQPATQTIPDRVTPIQP